MQDDRLQMLLTVFENMQIAADLKLGKTVSRQEKNVRVSFGPKSFASFPLVGWLVGGNRKLS